MSQIKCAECGKAFETTNTRYERRFCRKACHIVWKNRRNLRGAQVYDFIMTMRYDRAHDAEARMILQNLCRSFRESDNNARDGRLSWIEFEKAKAMVPLAFGTAGDGR